MFSIVHVLYGPDNCTIIILDEGKAICFQWLVSIDVLTNIQV